MLRRLDLLLDTGDAKPEKEEAGIKARQEEAQHRRARQREAAWWWLTTGEQHGAKPPYGSEWDRDYNPVPYPEARPRDITEYEGTGVGLLYGAMYCEHLWWSLAGWTLTRTHAEARKRRKK